MLKPLTAALLLVIVMSGCETPLGEIKKNEKITIDWIESHKKPISVTGFTTSMQGTRRYTFIDSNGKVFITDWTMMVLPEKIN